MTSDEAIAELKVMLADLPEQEDTYQPTPFWKKASDALLAEFEEDGFENFRCGGTPRSFFVPTYGVPGNTLDQNLLDALESTLLSHTEKGTKTYDTVMRELTGEAWAHADYRTVLAGDTPKQSPNISKVSESKTGNPSEHFCFEGRYFSRSMLNYLLGITFLKKHVQTDSITKVIEVGGGFGTLGEIFHQIGNYAYVDIDIPPTGAVASYYLGNTGTHQLIPYSATRKADAIPFPQPGETNILCPWQVEHLEGKADLAVNFISFQEMEPHVVRNYLHHIDRLETTYVLLRNLREGKRTIAEGAEYGVEKAILGSDYDTFLPNYKLIATNVHPFGYETIDGFHSELRLYERK